jgi:hypothetical protein
MSDAPNTVRRRNKAAHGRSAVSNRTRLFVEPQDARTAWARRYACLIHDIASDIGGIETLSELRLALVRRAACMIVEIERLEAALARGEAIDVDLLGRLTGHLRRLGETLGLDRATRDVTPDLASIIREHTADPNNLHRNAARAAARAPKPRAAPIIEGDAIEPIHGAPEPSTGAVE